MMNREFSPTVYILASRRNGTLYTGVTSDLIARIHKHRGGRCSGFTREYEVNSSYGSSLTKRWKQPLSAKSA